MSTTEYVHDLRALVGHAPVNLAGACALVLNSADEVLLQRRRDTGGWGTPGGIAELGEALEDTLRRELHEETGLRPLEVRLLTVVSGKETHVLLPGGDEFYQVTAVYVVPAWEGELAPDGSEGTELRFFPLDALPAGLGPMDRRALDLLRVCWGVE